VTFISDLPGKNSGKQGLGGGGRTTSQLAEALSQAQQRVTIQSPYLVLPEGGLELFAELIQRGVKVRISTNSLLSTDNLQAFSGYSKQRKELLKAGIEVYEFKPQPAIQNELIERYAQLEKQAPIFAIHAKTLVIDGEQLYIGTFNLDPRSANLNTEVGVIIKNQQLAKIVEAQIERDIHPDNSWNSAIANPNQFAPLSKRVKLGFWKLLPLHKLL
jgi:putative cardiolipin synthase